MSQKSLIAIGVLVSTGIICFLIYQLLIAPSPLQDREKVIGDIIRNWQHSHPSDNRFVILADFKNTAAFDKETGLIWELAPDPTYATWNEARRICGSRTTGGHKGWRLPSPAEMRSLVGPAVDAPGPHIPPGHPFVNIQETSYWTVVPQANLPSYAQYLDNFLGNVLSFVKIYTFPVWCVRGPVAEKGREP